MARQRERDLIVTIAALAATGLLIVLFSSGGQQAPSEIASPSPSRVRRDNGDNDGWVYSDEECELSCVDSDFCCGEKAASGDDEEPGLKAGRKKGGSKGVPKVVDISSQGVLDALRERYGRTVDLADLMQASGSYLPRARTDPEVLDNSGAVMEHIFDNDGAQCDSSRGSPSISSQTKNVYITFPQSIALFGRDKVGFYNQMVSFAQNMHDTIQGQSTSTRVFAGGHSVQVFKVKEITKRFAADAANYPLKVATNTGQPQWGNLVEGFIKKVNPQGQSVNQGNKCFFIWFIQDIPRDYRQALEGDIAISNFARQCTIYPVFFVPNDFNTGVLDHLVAALVPGSQGYAVANDKLKGYSVISLGSNEENLFGESLKEEIFSYMCMVEHNALCRVTQPAYFPPSLDDERAVDDAPIAASEAPFADSEEEAALTAAPADYDETADLPPAEIPIAFDPIDSCCGVHPYDANKYDVNVHVCCEYRNDDPRVGDTC